MNTEDIKKIIKKELAPLLIGIRNDLEDNKKSLDLMSEELKKKSNLEYELEVDDLNYKGDKGDTGATPTDEKLLELIIPLIPKKGKEYFTDSDISYLVSEVKLLLPTKEELKGKDGVVDYSTVEELAKPLIASKYKELKEEIKSKIDEVMLALETTTKGAVTLEQIIPYLESKKGSARLDAKAIKGLEKYVTTFIATSGGGGGSKPVDLSGYVPYTGATANLDLGSHYLKTDYIINNSGSYLGIFYGGIRIKGGDDSFGGIYSYDPNNAYYAGFIGTSATSVAFKTYSNFYIDVEANSFFANDKIGVGTNTPAYIIDAIGTGLNGAHAIRIKNTSANAGESAEFRAENDSGYSGRMFKLSSAWGTYKNLNANDLGFYNQDMGNISILNDYASGNINFSAGGLSSPQLTLETSGDATFSNNATFSGYDVAVNNAGYAYSVGGTALYTVYADQAGSSYYADNANIASYAYDAGNASFASTAGTADNVVSLSGHSTSELTNDSGFITSVAGGDHSTLSNLTTGDDHTQYAKLLGRTGGQTLIGGLASGNNLTLQSTSNATKGKIIFGTSAYDEVNNRLGAGIASPLAKIHSEATTEQLRLSYDETHYTSVTVSSIGQTVYSTNSTNAGVTFSGDRYSFAIQASGMTLNSTEGLTISRGTAGSQSQCYILFDRDKTFVNGDNPGLFTFQGRNSAGTSFVYSTFRGTAEVVTAGSEIGSLSFWTSVGADHSSRMKIYGKDVGIGLTTAPVGRLQVNANAVGDKILVLKEFGTHTGNVLEIQNSSGTIQTFFKPDGKIYQASAPIAGTNYNLLTGGTLTATGGIESGTVFGGINQNGFDIARNIAVYVDGVTGTAGTGLGHTTQYGAAIEGRMRTSGTAGTVANIYALTFQVASGSNAVGSTARVTNQYGINIQNSVQNGLTASSTHTIDNSYGLNLSMGTSLALGSGLVLTTGYGIRIAASNLTTYSGIYLSSSTTAGTINRTTEYGIRIEGMSGATNNYGVYIGANTVTATNDWGLHVIGGVNNYVEGSLGVGITTPQSRLHVRLNADSAVTATPVGLNVVSNGASGELIASSGVQTWAQYAPVINQSGTAGYTVDKINVTETATGSGVKLFADWGVGGTTKFSVDTGGEVLAVGRVREAGTFAEIYVADGVTAQSIPTGTTYTKLTAFTTNGSSSNCTADATNDKITITKAGKYLVTCTVSGNDGATGAEFKMALFYDGTEQANIHATNKFNAGSEIDQMSMSGIVVSAANKDIDVRLRHGEAGSVNFTTQYANLTITYIGE
jgi:hypothetical protein